MKSGRTAEFEARIGARPTKPPQYAPKGGTIVERPGRSSRQRLGREGWSAVAALRARRSRDDPAAQRAARQVSPVRTWSWPRWAANGP